MKNNAWFSVLSQFRPPIQNDYHDQQHEVWSSDKIDMPFGVRKEEFYPPRIETKFRPLTPSDQVLTYYAALSNRINITYELPSFSSS